MYRAMWQAAVLKPCPTVISDVDLMRAVWQAGFALTAPRPTSKQCDARFETFRTRVRLSRLPDPKTMSRSP